MHIQTFVAFQGELQKIAEEDLSFFERHPKKILGGLAALGTGAYLLSKGKKGKVPGGVSHAVSAPSKPASVSKPSSAPSTPKAPHTPKAPLHKSTPAAKKLTHEEAKALGYPGAGPKTTANQHEKHLGAEYIQAAREEGMRAGMPTEKHRAVTRASEVRDWVKKQKKSP